MHSDPLVCITLVESDRWPVSQVFSEAEILVGRSSKCHVRIDKEEHRQVSRIHGRVYCNGQGEWYYRDEDSTHGSFRQGERLDGPVPLEWGDVISLAEDDVVITVTWSIPRITGMAGTHLRRSPARSEHFPLAFSDPFIGRYDLYRQIGSGGFGDVWQAIAPNDGPARAVKLLRPRLLAIGDMDPQEREELVSRFIREVEVTRVLASSGVPGIARVYESGEDPNRDYIYIVMDFIEGLSLDRLIRRRRTLPEREAALYLLPIAKTLEAAHSIAWTDEHGNSKHGIVHRDIKPSNIMVEHQTRQSYLVDFGIAAINRGAERLTALDMTIGSVGYMPPEALSSSRADPAVDLWAFAVTLYVLLCNHLPYQGKTISEQYKSIRDHRYTDVTTWRTDVSPAVVASLRKALDPDPARRIQSAGEWVEILRELV